MTMLILVLERDSIVDKPRSEKKSLSLWKKRSKKRHAVGSKEKRIIDTGIGQYFRTPGLAAVCFFQVGSHLKHLSGVMIVKVLRPVPERCDLLIEHCGGESLKEQLGDQEKKEEGLRAAVAEQAGPCRWFWSRNSFSLQCCQRGQPVAGTELMAPRHDIENPPSGHPLSAAWDGHIRAKTVR